MSRHVCAGIYLKSKKNTVKGPAGKMRMTLKQICVERKLNPERFAVYHNGITVLSQRADVVDGALRLCVPYVPNGCQTIKNAFFFREDTNLKSRIADDLWRRVLVPVRVIETKDDDLAPTVFWGKN